ncbi:MAG: hypothetical protein V1752_05195 [Candidatus Firestonebacteria bacterium]
MTDKILRIIITAQCLILAVLLIGRYYEPKKVYAAVYKAHNSADPASLKLRITSISLTKEDGSQVTAWIGDEEVDFTNGAALTDIKTFSGNVPAGNYIQMSLYCGQHNPKVKGSVVLNGTTAYYTKASHTGYETGPAEEEEILPWGHGTGGFALQQNFYPAITIDSSVSSIHVLVDSANYLLYYDGEPTTSSGYDPMGSLNYANAGGKPAMFLGELPFAFAIGNPGTKEVYTYTTSMASSSGEGRLTLLFDGNDKLIGANAKSVLKDNTGIYFKPYGSLNSSYGSAGIGTDNWKDNGDGTYTMMMECIGPGAPTGAHRVTFPRFKRSTHSDTFDFINFQSGTDLTITSQSTENYTVTKLP